MEIAIGLGVPGDDLAEERQRALRIGVIDAADRRRGHLAEFQAVEATAGLQHAIGIAQRLVDVGDVPQAEGDRIGVEGAIGERQMLRIAGRPGKALQQPAVDGAVAPDLEHRGIDVAYGDVGPFALAVQQAEGDVAGAARHIQELLARPRVHHVDHGVLPEPVHAARHQVVHQVVARRHAGEDLAHQAGLFGSRHVAESEGGTPLRGLSLGAGCARIVGMGLVHGAAT